MMELVRYVLGNFWHFVGAVLLLAVAGNALGYVLFWAGKGLRKN